ncbi:hypothetical protein AVEN_117745-1 [Araneus ventricosus]|uniref:Uncharacterized protein n=1 Tax=Araneus ventricosus TaxID=182803 RepID=A0A4Y2B7F9_ARAVE|nr:hypothetical protein AVEN_117745-1 [Araneus ventricosus]
MSLYKLCVQKIAILLRDGIYKSCHENPFIFLPSNIVNNLMSAALDLQRLNGFRADDLGLILTSGRLQELKISKINVRDQTEIIKVLFSLKSGCQELEILHLTGPIDDELDNMGHTSSEVSEILWNLFKNTPNLKDLHCCFIFDLKALRNCRKLRI